VGLKREIISKESLLRFDNIIDSIGRTPLVKLNRITKPGIAAIYVKMESLNPGHSVKDRIGAGMIRAAEREGQLRFGMTIIEPTSGNTGIGLAMVAAARGYKIILTMPETASVERRKLMKLLGAEIILTPGADGMKGAITKAQELADEHGYFQPMQFSNPANPAIHCHTTAMEIIGDLGDINLDAFIAGVGTGGTLTGTGEVLKSVYNCKIYAVEPADSPVLSGGAPGLHQIQGIGAGFVPDNYNSEIVDEVIQVTNDDAYDTARELASREGILGGISAGANVWATLKVAEKLGQGRTVVTVICDTAERYLSTPLIQE
jgi:cysteine synthase A